MGLDFQIVPITADESAGLESFVASLGEELRTFRYFKSRPFDVLRNHVFTCLIIHENNMIGYGHLDEEDGVVWMGLLIKKEFQGKGLASHLIGLFILKGKELGLKHIQLTVDADRPLAIKLYERFGFKEIARGKSNLIMRRKI
jgi:ribosomal protein S18 acetylase RimI-like enzyme